MLTQSPQIPTTGASHEDIMASLIEPNDFIYYSTLTVIYRAQTFSNKTMEVNSKCYEAAKLSLQTHLRCHEKLCSQHMDKRLDYVNW